MVCTKVLRITRLAFVDLSASPDTIFTHLTDRSRRLRRRCIFPDHTHIILLRRDLHHLYMFPTEELIY